MEKNATIFIFIFIFGFLILLSDVSATTIVYTSTGTGNIDKDCNSPTGCINNEELLLAGNGVSSYRYHAYIYFNMTEIENKNAVIYSAFLNLTVTSAQEDILVPVHRITIPWIINDTLPSISSNFTSYTTHGSIEGSVDSVNVSSAVNGFSNGSYTNYGFMLNGTPGGTDFTVYGSFDEPTASKRPKLIVSYDIASSKPLLNTTNSSNFSTSTPTLKWNNSTDVGTTDSNLMYHIQVDNNSDFSSPEYENNTIAERASPTNATTSSLVDGVYYWRVESNTSQGLVSGYNETFTFRVDTTAPSVSIVYPVDTASYDTNTISLNYTASDAGIGLQTCWYRNNTDSTNITLTCGANTTISQGTDGTYTAMVCANDTLGNQACDTHTFTISTTAPAITLNYPPNNTFFNRLTNIYLNYTATDSNLISECQIWHNLNGSFSKNQTNRGITSGQMNFTIVNTSSDGVWLWNVWCNDTNGDATFSSSNKSFITDTTYPAVNIIALTTTTGSQTITLTVSSSDTNLNTCKYSIFNSTGGIDGIYENISVGCNTGASPTVSAFGTFNLTFYAIDKSGNENSTTQAFTVSDLPPTTSGGGGGGTLSSIELIPVISLQPITESEKEYSETERAVIFSAINNYCSFSISKEDVASRDYSSECLITIEDLRLIIQNLAKFEVASTEKDMMRLYQNYKNKLLEQVFASKDEIVKYNLFSSVLGLISRLQISPSPDYDSYAILYEPELGSAIVPIDKVSNKPLKSCELISNNPELKCEIQNKTNIHITFEINQTNFLTKTFSGRLLVTTEAEPDKVETQQMNITIRAINIGGNQVKVIGIGAGVVLVFSIIIFRIVRPKYKNKTIKQLKELAKI